MLRGGPGTGKTIFALNILCYGLEMGEPWVLVTCDESPTELLNHANALHLDLARYLEEGRARILDMRPDRSDVISGQVLELDPVLARIDYAVQQTGAQRLVIDAIDSMDEAFAGAEAAIRNELARVFDWLREHKTTTVITAGERGENVLYMSFEEGEKELLRNQKSVGLELGGWDESAPGDARNI